MADDQQKPAAGDKRAHSEMSADNVTTMLSTTQQIEDIFTTQKVDDLDRLASGKVTLHKDSITLAADIQGIDNLKKYYQVGRAPVRFMLLNYPAVLAAVELTLSCIAGFLQEI